MNDDVSVFQLFDDRWFYVVRHYDSDENARAAFVKMNEHSARLKGKAEIAGYRLLDALPARGGKPRVVVVIGLEGKRVREAADMLDGEPWPMGASHIRGLVLRRVRFLLAARAMDQKGGTYVFQHGKGMWLDESGNVVPSE